MLNDRHFGGLGVGVDSKTKTRHGIHFQSLFSLVLVINRHTSLVSQVAVYANFVLPS